MVRIRLLGFPGLALVLTVIPAVAAPQASATSSVDPAALYRQLNEVGLDQHEVYFVRGAQIVRGGAKIYFDRGFVGLLGPVAGEVTGAVFTGEGEVLLIPPNPVEKRSLAEFTGAMILEEHFVSALMRFTDGTARELAAKGRRPEPDDPQVPEGFLEYWRSVTSRLNPEYSGEILIALLGDRSRPFFQATLQGVELGQFQVADDERLPEAVSVGAIRTTGSRAYEDVWCSFPSRTSASRDSPFSAEPARVESYKLDVTIRPDNSLEGSALLELVSLSDKERVLAFELSRGLEVTGAKDGEGKELEIIQPEARKLADMRANGVFLVALPAPYAPRKRYRLAINYQGQVIADAGNGVLYVGAHANWYPNPGVGSPASYDLTFHYPERLRLVATGEPVSETAADGMKNSHWVSKEPIRVAGFNLGNYVEQSRRAGRTTIEIYATREAEAALEKRRNISPAEVIPEPPPRFHGILGGHPRPLPEPLSPAALLGRVAERAALAVGYFETLFGPFPYPRLAISQIPGEFGQGWPELVYLPTFYFLPSAQRSEVSPAGRLSDLQTETVIAHEVAHQWWGNEVGWKTYHDQWISEGLASYAAALFLAREKDGERRLYELLKQYRRELLSKNKEGKTIEAGGPIWLGSRLSTSLNPSGYDDIVYKKACWVLHMLRVMMRDPAAGSDRRFFEMLRDFVAKYRGQAPSTEDFVRHAGKYMTPAMDLERNGRLEWFFDTWVYGTGIPSYRLEAKTRHLAGGRFAVQGTIEQSGVSEDFEMLVPVVATVEKGRKRTLGLVPVSGSGGSFRFVVPERPSRISVDTENLLTVTP